MTQNTSKIHTQTRVDTKYHFNGEIKSQIHYVNDKKHGLETEWDENGVKKWENIWVDGKQHGVMGWWAGNGSKLMEVYYTHNKLSASIQWNEKKKVAVAIFPNPPINTTRKPRKLKKSQRTPKKK